MATRRALTSLVIAGIIPVWTGTTSAQSTAGATVAQGPSRGDHDASWRAVAHGCR